MMDAPLFVYGSLIFPEVWGRVVEDGGRHRRVAGRAVGYTAFCVEGESYPGLVKAEGGTVDGVLIFGLSGEDWAVLDAFEGEFYGRGEIEVRSEGGETFLAQSYLVAEGFEGLLSGVVWDVGIFEETGLRGFLERFCGS